MNILYCFQAFSNTEMVHILSGVFLYLNEFLRLNSVSQGRDDFIAVSILGTADSINNNALVRYQDTNWDLKEYFCFCECDKATRHCLSLCTTSSFHSTHLN